MAVKYSELQSYYKHQIAKMTYEEKVEYLEVANKAVSYQIKERFKSGWSKEFKEAQQNESDMFKKYFPDVAPLTDLNCKSKIRILLEEEFNNI